MRNDGFFISSGCKLDLPMLDVACSDVSQKSLLQQWQCKAGNAKYLSWLQDPDIKSVRRDTYELWKAWEKKGGVTVENKMYNETKARY